MPLPTPNISQTSQEGFNVFQVSLVCFVVLFTDSLTPTGAENISQHHWLDFPSGASMLVGPTF